MFCRIDCVTYKMGVNWSKTTNDATVAAFQAVDKRHLRKLKKAMAKRNNGAALDCQRSSTSSSGSGDDTHEMSLLEYAVEKDWLDGVARMLKVSLSLSPSPSHSLALSLTFFPLLRIRFTLFTLKVISSHRTQLRRRSFIPRYLFRPVC